MFSKLAFYWRWWKWFLGGPLRIEYSFSPEGKRNWLIACDRWDKKEPKI